MSVDYIDDGDEPFVKDDHNICTIVGNVRLEINVGVCFAKVADEVVAAFYLDGCAAPFHRRYGERAVKVFPARKTIVVTLLAEFFEDNLQGGVGDLCKRRCANHEDECKC